MRSILNPPSGESKRFFRRRRCPLCGKRFSTEPRFVRHTWICFTARELGLEWSEAERLWDEHGKNLVHRGADGRRFMALPDEPATKEER